MGRTEVAERWVLWRDMATDFDPGIDGLTRFRRVGAGGFSTVFVAWEEEFSRWVAVKIFHDLDETAGRRFSRERSLMGQSSGHPNVITPIRSGLTVDGKPYLVMQFMEGGSLQDRINRGEVLPWRDAIAVIRPIAEALGDSHQAGILHKDVKPANILLARNGTPSLTDFGIASVRGATVTQTAFTFAHSPPETFLGGKDARDERSDLYSLASTLYAVIAGRAPFADAEDNSQLAWLDRVVNRPLPPLGVDQRLDRFLAWAMAKDPADRPQSARQFVEGLDQVLAGDPWVDRVPGPGVEHPPPILDDHTPPAPTLGRGEVADRGLAGQLLSRGDRRWATMAGWAVALVALAGIGAGAWFALLRDPGDTAATTSTDAGGLEGSTDSSLGSSASGGLQESSGGAGTTGEDGAPPPRVQEAILLLQDPDSDVTTLVTHGVLPGTDITAGGFTFRSCETQLVGLQTAFGGTELGQLREEIARWPSGAPEGYDDPVGAGRGFRERLEAYVEQTEIGYRDCLERADISPVGSRVLAGWAAMQSFLCVTGAVEGVVLDDGTEVGCPVLGELELCSRILTPLLDDFFQAFPDSRPDASAACRAAIENDPAQFDALSPPA